MGSRIPLMILLRFHDPLEKGMAAHFSILAWGITLTGAWQATVHVAAKSRTGLSHTH